MMHAMIVTASFSGTVDARPTVGLNFHKGMVSWKARELHRKTLIVDPPRGCPSALSGETQK